MLGRSRPLELRGRPLVGLVLGLLSGLAAGCGGGAGAPTDASGAGGATGAGGKSVGGTSGTGAGGTGASGGTAGGSGLPRCAVAARPQDPMNANGGAIPAMCNSGDFGGSWVTSEAAILGADGTITLDGGTPELPAGGTIADGDYDLVRLTGGWTTRRSIRVFGQATYIEWIVDNQDSTQPDGGVMDFRFNTSAQATGTTLAISVVCGQVNITSGYGYTAAGDQLTLFYEGNPPGPMIMSAFVYQRTCAR